LDVIIEGYREGLKYKLLIIIREIFHTGSWCETLIIDGSDDVSSLGGRIEQK
jgi:hypothetical protein